MVSDMNIFVWKLSKIAAQKKVFFSHFFTFEVPFKGLFAPTSRSRMSNIFRDSESLGKSNGKKWSNIWTFLFGNGLKSPRKKKFFVVVAYFALQNMVETTLPPSYGIGATIRIGREMLCLPYAGFFLENSFSSLFFCIHIFLNTSEENLTESPINCRPLHTRPLHTNTNRQNSSSWQNYSNFWTMDFDVL